MNRFRHFPVLFACVCVFLAAGRWGSHLHVPGVPFYIGDAMVVVAVGQAVSAWRRGTWDLGALRAAPRTLHLGLAFLAWVVLRTVTRTALPLVALRDFAPYAYAICIALGYLAPVTTERARLWLYGAFAFHATWYAAATHGVVNANTTLRLGPDITLFSTRPDFDSAVFGIAIAFALHQLLMGPRPRSRAGTAALIAFAGANLVIVATQHSRSGLVSTAVAIFVALFAWLSQRRGNPTGRASDHQVRVVVSLAALALAVLGVMFTVPGQRLAEGISGNNEAGGTSRARSEVWGGVSEWILDSPVRTTFGVGYGPNILARSGTVDELEGTAYENVRAPHNYLLNSWGRLGLIGAGLALALFLAAGRMAFRRLRTAARPADVVAALLVITLPVPALLGVILESPFGAIPYFWGVGQLCAGFRRAAPPDHHPSEAPALAGAQA